MYVSAAESEEESGPSSPSDVKDNIKSKYQMEMPEDFYHLWDVAKSINASNPQGIYVYDC